MTSLTHEVWGREFNLPVCFEDLDDDGISEAQWEAYGRIVANWRVIDDALPELKEYCVAENPQEVGPSPDNVFRFVIPRSLFVSDEGKRRVVALMCDYRFDPEHGIAIVFENEALKTIDLQDVVL